MSIGSRANASPSLEIRVVCCSGFDIIVVCSAGWGGDAIVGGGSCVIKFSVDTNIHQFRGKFSVNQCYEGLTQSSFKNAGIWNGVFICVYNKQLTSVSLSYKETKML